MKGKICFSERGQAIVLVALGFVVLLGFAALAVDGSLVYADRRFAQNAADAASLAGGGVAAITLENAHIVFSQWDCDSSNVQAAQSAAVDDAIERAADNGYVIDEDIEDPFERGVDDGGVTTECVDQAGGSLPDRYLDIHTRITAQSDTAFLQFVFGGQMLNTVDAITRIRPRSNLAFGHAIVALNPEGCQGQQNGAKFHGTADVYIIGGGVFSNGCLRGDGNQFVDVTDGSVNYVVEFNEGGDFNPYPEQVPNHLPPDAYRIDPPDCSHPAAYHVNGNQLVGMSPLEPGLYCIHGAVRVNAHDELIGNGVTLYLVDDEMHINGNALVQLSAPPLQPDPSPAIGGVVILAPESNTKDLTLNGNSDSYFQGVILMPGSNIDMLGTGFIDAYHTQVIGWNVQAGGTADISVTFHGQNLYTLPTSLELAR